MHNKRSKTGRGLLLAILLLTFLHQEGQAQSYTVDGVKYYVSDGNATVMGLEDTSIPELEIPEEIQVDGNTVPVTAIRKEAFFQSNLTEVRMSNAILTIGASCFRASKQLKKVVLSEAITEIPDWAFAGCSSLDDIYLRVGVTSIGQRAFSGCNFTTIVLPESLMQIGSQAFNSCLNLESIVIPPSITSLDNTFEECTSLTHVDLGNVTTLTGAFKGCTSLTDVTLPTSLTTIGKESFRDCKMIYSITLPNSVTKIDDLAFSGCNISTFSIPASVIEIEGTPFGSTLTEVIFEDGTEYLDLIKSSGSSGIYDMFSGCKLATVYIGRDFRYKNEYGQYYTSMSASETTPDTPFFYNRDIKEVTFGTTVTTIPNGLFWESLSLKTVKFTSPSSIEKIGMMAFEDCAMKTIEIPGSVTSIGTRAFSGCDALESVYYNTRKPAISDQYLFSSDIYSTATLYMPPATLLDIENFTPWNRFVHTEDWEPGIVFCKSITLNVTEWNGGPGDTFNITATISPTNTTDKSITWTSSDENIAKVDENGKVTAISLGETIITAQSSNPKVAATCKVIVSPIEVTSVTIEPESWSGMVGESFILKVTVLPENATDKGVYKMSNDGSVAQIEGDVIKAVGIGETTILIGTSNTAVATTCKVTVLPTPVTALTLNQTEWAGEVGESFTITATVAPEAASDKTLSWTSSNEAVATVDANGKVTAIALGEATITVTTSNPEVSATCTVKVVPTAVSAITIDPKEWAGEIGESFTITATVAPEAATDKTLSWTSSNEAVATVDARGKVTAIALGEATIIVTTSNPEVSATCTVTVLPTLVVSITLDPEEWSGAPGETFTIKATVSPENVTDKTLSWTSSDATIAAVDSEGRVEVLRNGTCTVTATSTDGSNVSAVCVITGMSGIYGLFVSEDEQADVYDVKGALIRKGADREHARQLVPGVYILKFSSRAVKVVIR